MSLLQTPRRPSSDGIVLGPPEGRALATPFGTLHGDEGPQVDLGRELDLAAERPSASGRSERGPGVLVATIVASSLALGGIILALRDDPSPARPSEQVAVPRSAVVTAPAEPAPVPTPAPVEPPPVERVATKTKPAPAPTPATQPAAPSEITPAAIAPATPARPGPAARPTAPVEPTPSSGLAPGLSLPAPVFDEPAQPEPAQPEPTQPEPTPSEPTPSVAEPLPGIDERAPAEPVDAPDRAAVPTDDVDAPHAVEPLDLLDLDTVDRAPARADRPAS